METKNKPSLLKQIGGAVVGSAVALALYYSYQFAAPRVTAYVTLPQAERQHDLGDARVADSDATQQEFLRIQSRNQEVAKRLAGADPQDYKLENPDKNTAWPTQAAVSSSSSSALAMQASSIAVQNNDGWQDFIRDTTPPKPVVQQAAAAQTAMHSGAPALPDSGFGAVAAAFAAFGATASRFTPLLKRKSRK